MLTAKAKACGLDIGEMLRLGALAHAEDLIAERILAAYATMSAEPGALADEFVAANLRPMSVWDEAFGRRHGLPVATNLPKLKRG